MSLIFNKDQYLSSLFMYQFQSPQLSELAIREGITIEVSKKTKKPRYLFLNKELFGTIRASTGRLVLSLRGALWIHSHLPKPQYRVFINPEIIPFLKTGRSLFAKFIIDCDTRIRIGDEVLIVDPEDHLIASGRAKLNGQEMIKFTMGPAARVHKVVQHKDLEK